MLKLVIIKLRKQYRNIFMISPTKCDLQILLVILHFIYAFPAVHISSFTAFLNKMHKMFVCSVWDGVKSWRKSVDG